MELWTSTEALGSIGIVQNIELAITLDLECKTIETSIKVILENPSVYVCLCVSALL